MMTSSEVTMPRSPWLASAGWTKKAGVPVDDKIAATLSSTGTPAFFVHPAEASHGDLGMVTSDDVIIAISWSGETAELKNLINYSRRFRIGLIAITSDGASTLGQAADIPLVLPQ